MWWCDWTSNTFKSIFINSHVHATRHFGKTELSVDLETLGKDTQLKDLVQVQNQSNLIFMKEIWLLKNTEKKRNVNTKLHILQNDQNADTILLHSQD